MRNKRFNFLSFFNIHQDLTDELIILADSGNKFVSLHDSRYHYFRKFGASDLNQQILLQNLAFVSTYCVYSLYFSNASKKNLCSFENIFFFVLPYFFSSYGFVSRSSPLPVSLTCCTRKFGPLTRKTKSPAPDHAINIDDTVKNS